MLLSMQTGSAAPPEPDGPSRLLSHEQTVGRFDKTVRRVELYREYLGAQIECLANWVVVIRLWSGGWSARWWLVVVQAR